MTRTITGTLYARPETGFIDSALLEKYGIAEWFTLYVIADDGSTTVDLNSPAVENVFMFYLETPEHIREDAREDLDREALDEPYYLMRAELSDADPRFTVALSVDVDEDEEIFDLTYPLMESVHMGCEDDPAILDYETWAAWRRERTDKRRTRNLPPIANWGVNGLDNLPLFVAAAQPILQARLARAERLSERVGACAASKWQRKPVEALNWSWPL